ncbi:MAG: hypothetical protein A2622_13050 [Bdellovibrionales bacterium RIFCSPHIGHO2_01_FULL_40_29]|nr:MAG: hypothetical protein A2622_13050 [Bdellovibrionales bacterium RIFCSPHIGHO2_01_FULL_40_29]OFZ33382.1 MAG: hypothetical protein A3D17_13835 [Bdellovibrionales bacterium RIFCSPHIGHO2_02_FULL_40_15]
MTNTKSKIHIRRCHVCSTVNEQENDFVTKCDGCGKSLAPFMFFDERNEFDPSCRVTAGNMNIDEVRLKSGSLYDHMKSQYPPLWGITVYW